MFDSVLNTLLICLPDIPRILLQIMIQEDHLTLFSWRRSLSYKNQSTNLFCKSMDWFLYYREFRHERVKIDEKVQEKKPIKNDWNHWHLKMKNGVKKGTCNMAEINWNIVLHVKPESNPHFINSFHATGFFLYPMITSESLWFSDVFWGYRRRPVHGIG